jgi:hypothetical protein
VIVRSILAFGKDRLLLCLTSTSNAHSDLCLASMSSQPASTFRSQLAGFRWANGIIDDSPAAPSTASQGGGGGGIWGSLTNSVSAYVPLRSNERSNEEEAYFALSRWERYVHASGQSSSIP